MAKTFGKIMLGEGVLTYNNGSTDVDLGYTRGGSFNDNLIIRHIEVDGKKGNVKGDAIIESCTPELEFTTVQMQSELLEVVFANVTVADAAGIKTMTRKVTNILEEEYLDDVTFTGKTVDGKDIKIKLLNALGEGPATLTFTDKAEVEVPCMFTGNYTSIADTTAPYEVILDETA